MVHLIFFKSIYEIRSELGRIVNDTGLQSLMGSRNNNNITDIWHNVVIFQRSRTSISTMDTTIYFCVANTFISQIIQTFGQPGHRTRVLKLRSQPSLIEIYLQEKWDCSVNIWNRKRKAYWPRSWAGAASAGRARWWRGGARGARAGASCGRPTAARAAPPRRRLLHLLHTSARHTPPTSQHALTLRSNWSPYTELLGTLVSHRMRAIQIHMQLRIFVNI